MSDPYDRYLARWEKNWLEPPCDEFEDEISETNERSYDDTDCEV